MAWLPGEANISSLGEVGTQKHPFNASWGWKLGGYELHIKPVSIGAAF